eukprot:maker-scaffold_6-snap-gene-13.6-mRNA-1 protein AED:0.23 eAED:0.23 QI:0/0/0/0.5/1/1/2/0/1731
MPKTKTRNKSKSFKKGAYVWVRDEDLIVTPGKVLKGFKKGQPTTLQLVERDNQEIKLKGRETEHIKKCDKRNLNPQDDLTKLRQLTEDSILFALRKRFSEDTIYTALGPVLVSVNPFKELPIYSPDILDSYMSDTGNKPPHVFQIAQRNYSQMINNRQDQCCIVTGESGAGKTEATKLILQFLTEKSSAASPASRSRSEELSKKILDMNPLLEAFGNAKTGRNNNSSRFGKLTQMQFNANTGEVIGVGIVDYLLEKSRIVQQQESERNFHVFYQLCVAATQGNVSDLSYEVKYAENYYYLTQTADPEQTEVNGINDADDWRKTYDAMSTLGISSQDRKNIVDLLAGILFLGNVQFDPRGSNEASDPAEVRSMDILSRAAKALGFQDKSLYKGLLTTQISTSKDSTYKEHTVQQASDARDALAKAIYAGMFEYLITKINEGLKVVDDANTLTINVLDIFGFEQFEFNSFEQLCINYCNEKLQVHFVDNIFKYEQEAYKKEGIEVKNIEFEDNAEVLAVIEDRSKGVYALLDEQNKLPNGSDEMFLKKLLDGGISVKNRDNAKLKKPNINEIRRNPYMEFNFNIVHFAGEVSYNVANFLEKNSDRLLPSLQDLANKSSNAFVQQLIPVPTVGKTSRKTLGLKFQRQLEDLMAVLNSSQPHFVRTIKSNAEKRPNGFTSSMVLQQIRCAGLLGVCEVHKRGYPIRYEFKEFLDRYGMILEKRSYDAESLCIDLQNSGLLANGEWQIGRTKVFLRSSMQDELENARDEKLGVYAIKLQKVARGFLVRKRFGQVRKLVSELNKAMMNKDLDELRALIEYSTNVPKTGNLREVIQEAKAVLAEVEATDEIVAKLQLAVQNQDRIVIENLLVTLEDQEENIRRRSIIYEAQTLLDELDRGGMDMNFDGKDVDDIMHIIWEKMSGNFGVNKNDIRQLNDIIAQLEDEGDEELLDKADRLLEIANLQLDAQDIIRNALESKDLDDLKDAMELIQDLDLSTNDAKRVQNILLKNNLANQNQPVPRAPGSVNLSNLVNLSTLSARLDAGNMNRSAMNNARVSAVVDMSNRLSRVNRLSAVGFGALGPRFSARQSAALQPRNSKMQALSVRMNAISNRYSAALPVGGLVMKEDIGNAPVSIRQTMALMNNDMMSGNDMVQVSRFELENFYQIREDEDFYEGMLDQKDKYPKMKWTGSPLNKSLTLLNDAFNKLAIQVNKSILQFCGDIQFQYPNLAARFVLVTAAENPELTDEIYLQIIKNLTENTRVNSEDRAWMLLILATQQFPPTPEFEPYLFSFLLGLKDAPLLIGNYTRLCIVQLDRTIELGPSAEFPDVDVIASYAARPALLLSLRQPLTEETIDIPVYPDVDVETVVQSASEFAQLSAQGEKNQFYGLFMEGEIVETQSKFASRLENFYTKWDPSKIKHIQYFAATWQEREEELFSQLVKKYGPEPPMNQGINRASVRKPAMREDVADADLSQPIPWWIYPGDVFLQMTLKGKEPVFTLQRKLFLPQDISRGTREVVDVISDQIRRGELAVKDYEDISVLAAIAFTLKLSGPPTDVKQLLSTGLNFFLPQIWLNAQSETQTATQIIETARSLSSLRPRDMLTRFLQTASKSDGYGRWFYPIVQITENDQISVNGDIEIAEDADYIGVGYTGIGVFDGTRTECMFEYKYEEIEEYGAANGSFWMNLKQGTRVDLQTEVPWELYSIVYEYIQYRASAQENDQPVTSFDRNSVMRTRAY